MPNLCYKPIVIGVACVKLCVLIRVTSTGIMRSRNRACAPRLVRLYGTNNRRNALLKSNEHTRIRVQVTGNNDVLSKLIIIDYTR